MSFGEKVKHTRESMGISQNKLAKLSGIAQSSISYLESGDKKPSIETLTLIAKALDMPPQMFLDNAEISNSFPPNISELVKIATQLNNQNIDILIRVAKAILKGNK
jgi:transcriptional regulator with XRE-family HTH domain